METHWDLPLTGCFSDAGVPGDTLDIWVSETLPTLDIKRAYIVDPVGRQDTPRIHPLVKGAAPSSDLLWSHLCRIHRYDDTEAAHSQTSNKSSRIPSTKRTGIDCFDDSPKNKHSRGANNSILAAIFVGKWVDDEARDERAELFQADRERVYF